MIYSDLKEFPYIYFDVMIDDHEITVTYRCSLEYQSIDIELVGPHDAPLRSPPKQLLFAGLINAGNWSFNDEQVVFSPGEF